MQEKKIMIITRSKQKQDKDDQAKEEEVTVNKEAKNLNVGEDLFGGCLPKTMYETILARKLTVLGSFNIMKTMVKYLARLRRVKLTEAEIG